MTKLTLGKRNDVLANSAEAYDPCGGCNCSCSCGAGIGHSGSLYSSWRDGAANSARTSYWSGVPFNQNTEK